jgi:hypothetical protein
MLIPWKNLRLKKRKYHNPLKFNGSLALKDEVTCFKVKDEETRYFIFGFEKYQAIK